MVSLFRQDQGLASLWSAASLAGVTAVFIVSLFRQDQGLASLWSAALLAGMTAVL